MVTVGGPNAYTTILTISKENIEKIDFIQCKEPTQTLEQLRNSMQNKPNVLINGGFFNLSTGKTVMDFIDNYIQKYNDLTWNSYGIGIKSNGQLQCGYEDEEWKDFLTAFPPLLINGQFDTMQIAKSLDYKTRRSIIGYNDKNIYLITIDNPGATFKEAAAIAAQAGCLFAINLDGGASTRMLFDNKTYAAASYNRPIDNAIGIYLKQQRTIYRVQLGAFARKESAVAYCEEIKKIMDTTKTAFVKFVSPYYKVQVGAFTVKSNAEKLVLQLKSKGYNSFIVKEVVSL